MGCLTFELSHPENSVSSNSTLEIFDSDHQAQTGTLRILQSEKRIQNLEAKNPLFCD